MNSFLTTQTAQRAGISVVEVLTAIVVAMIGVFGVMILIPFAVQQAENGLDRDEASIIGRNAFEQFEIEGFRFVDSNGDTRFRAAAGSLNVDPASPLSAARVIVVDPLPVSATGVIGSFPADFPAVPTAQFGQVNLNDDLGDAFTTPVARKMFRSTDDLQFTSALTELGAPQQVFDVDSDGLKVRRQSQGRMSWNAVLVPVKDDYDINTVPAGGTPPLKYKMHVLVHKDRELEAPSATGPRYPTRAVTSPLTGTGFGGGTVTVEKLPDVRKDDWVMLVNQANGGEPGFDKQVAFYQVAGVSNENPANTILTINGPDFAFGTGATQLVHLVQFRTLNGSVSRGGRVINIFERTMRWEQKSNWN